MITRRQANVGLLSTAIAVSLPNSVAAATIGLSAPQKQGGKPLMEALQGRRSIREYADRAIPMEVLSSLLWAAWGINRPQSGLRTAPSSHEYMDVALYLAMQNGVWIYDAVKHRLVQHLQDDVRAETTTGQEFVRTAPLNIVYVSDAARMGALSPTDRLFNGVADSAVIAQNVYLFCASEGLATVLRGSVPGVQLAKRLNLASTQAIYLAQTVGYPRS